MNIQDLHGKNIEVTDLAKAIQQAENLKDYEHEDKSFADFDARLKTYWTDVYNKLLLLKKYQNEHPFKKD